MKHADYEHSTGWFRYLDCILYRRNGIVLRGYYANDNTGAIVELVPVRIRNGSAQCYRASLRDGYFALVNEERNLRYDEVTGRLKTWQ